MWLGVSIPGMSGVTQIGNVYSTTRAKKAQVDLENGPNEQIQFAAS